MKKTFASESFLGLPPWAKGVVAVALIGGASYIAWKIYKGIQQGQEGKGGRKEDKSWDEAFDKLNSNSQTKATISKPQMLAYANVLQAAMNGMGTDSDQVKSVFKNIKNDADFAGIASSYGVRTLNSGIWGVSDYKGTLAGALADELSQSDKDIINKDLASRKITYKI